MKKMKKCPRCKRMTLDPDMTMNCLSRRGDRKIYICNTCGNEEALIDDGCLQPTSAEKAFIKTHKRKQEP